MSWTNFAVWTLQAFMKDQNTEARLSCNTSAAAEWITHSGEILFEKFGEEKDMQEGQGLTALDGLVKGGESIPRDTWIFWRHHFDILGDKGSGTVKTVAQEAKRNMQAIEKNRVE